MPKQSGGGGQVTSFAPAIGEPPAVQFFAPDRLTVDHAYQRQLQSNRSQKLVFAIANAWDWRLCMPLLVSERAEGLFILDGQHRWAAAKLRGDIPFLPCAAGRFSSVAEEAMLFVAANRKRVQVNRIDLFRAALAAGHADECVIDELLRAAGLTMAPHANPKHYGPGEIGCTSALLAALRQQGRETTAAALAVIGEAFAGEALAQGGVIFKALLRLLKNPPVGFTRDRLIETLRKRTADDWALHPRVTLANGGEQRALELRKVIVEQMGLAAPAGPGRPRSEPGASRTFEEQLAAVERGEARVVRKLDLRRPDPQVTLGGVGSAML